MIFGFKNSIHFHRVNLIIHQRISYLCSRNTLPIKFIYFHFYIFGLTTESGRFWNTANDGKRKKKYLKGMYVKCLTLWS
jgi:hypothetical protein